MCSKVFKGASGREAEEKVMAVSGSSRVSGQLTQTTACRVEVISQNASLAK